MTRVAAFDCGTNSLRLLIADIGDDGAREIDRRMEVVRLGQGVDATGGFAPEALGRTFAVVDEYAALCRDCQVDRIRFVATSASRDANNRDEFTAGIRSRLGVDPEVVTGDEEADLSFVGATKSLASHGLTRAGGPPVRDRTAPSPQLVVDLGGGSTELVLGDADGGVKAASSMNIGCVRMTERHLHSDPPTAAEIAAARADVGTALEVASDVVPLSGVGSLIGVAGTVTTVTAHALGLPNYDRDAIHGTELSLDTVFAACDSLTAMTRAERAALPYMHPGRVDVIGAGALVWRLVVERVAAASGIGSVFASEEDILDGIAWKLA